jgi:nitroreductase
MQDWRPEVDEALVGYLKTRRSIPAAQLGEPGPDPDALREMLRIAARVPDHGKLAPWRFIVFDRKSRNDLIRGLARIAETSADEKERRYRADKAAALAEAPLIVGVVSSATADHPKIPLWEQQLSAGAVCLNLLHAAKAFGFAAQWLTGWFAYDPEAQRWLGLREGERFAGLVHIGTPTAPPSERDRPDLVALVSMWRAAN